MDAIEFIQNYPGYVSELEEIVKPELLPVIDELKSTDPHGSGWSRCLVRQ